MAREIERVGCWLREVGVWTLVNEDLDLDCDTQGQCLVCWTVYNHRDIFSLKIVFTSESKAFALCFM